MKKYIVVLCLGLSILPILSFASDNEDIIEQGATSNQLLFITDLLKKA